MKEIPLSRGCVALVDDEDYGQIVAAGPWHAHPSGRTFYARHSVSPGRALLMHHLVTGLQYVDHANGDGLDNRRANLRSATHGQNMANRRRGLNNTSGYKGVTWHRQRERWQARIWAQGRCRSLGLHDTPELAAAAYDAAARQIFGEFARLNFDTVRSSS